MSTSISQHGNDNSDGVVVVEEKFWRNNQGENYGGDKEEMTNRESGKGRIFSCRRRGKERRSDILS